MSPLTIVFALNILAKVILLLGLGFVLLFPDLPQFEAKSMTLRVVLYPIFGFGITAYYHLASVRTPYPHLTDLLWTFTFTFDLIGNNFNLYNEFYVFQQIVHFVNSVPYFLVMYAVMVGVERLGYVRLGFWANSIFVFSLYSTVHILWEMWEHLMDRFFGTFLQPGGMREATEDQLFSMAGALVAIALLYYLRESAFLERALLQPTAGLVRSVVERLPWTEPAETEPTGEGRGVHEQKRAA